MKTGDGAGSACRKRGNLWVDEIKLPFTEGRTKEKSPPNHGTKEKAISDGKTNKKPYPGCGLCGISSFPTVNSSLSHLTTPEHCRRTVLQTAATRFVKSARVPPVDSNHVIPDRQVTIPSPSTPLNPIGYERKQSHRQFQQSDTCTAEQPFYVPNNCPLNPIGYERKQNHEQHQQSDTCTTELPFYVPDNCPLNPIGYERKQRHKQCQQSDTCITEHTFYVPDNCTFNCNGETSRTEQYFSGIPLNPFQTEYKCESLISSDYTLEVETLPQICVPLNNLDTQFKNLYNLVVISSDQTLPL